MFGKTITNFQNETTFHPVSPMVSQNVLLTGLQKIIGTYGMYACNGILFNHESPIRGETFVTKKFSS